MKEIKIPKSLNTAKHLNWLGFYHLKGFLSREVVEEDFQFIEAFYKFSLLGVSYEIYYKGELVLTIIVEETAFSDWLKTIEQ